MTDTIRAAVATLGSVNPVPPASGGTFLGHLVVGDEQALDSDIRGWLQLDQGTVLQYGNLIVGDEEQFFGDAHVLADFLGGINTKLTLSGAGSNAAPTVQIGRDGSGNLDVRGGATLTLTNATGNFSVGVRETGVGSVSLAGPFTIVTVPMDFTVGQEGVGQVDISSGALVRTINNSGSRAIRLGTDATGVGTLTVQGAGSVLRGGSSLIVGGAGQGLLTVKNQGIVDADNTSSASTTLGSDASGVGMLIVDGPGSVLRSGRNLVVGSEGQGTLTIMNQGLVDVAEAGLNDPPAATTIGAQATGVGTLIVDGPGSLLRPGVNLVVGNSGQGTLIVRNQGIVELDSVAAATTTVGAFGRIEMQGGTLIGNKPAVGFGTTVDGFLGGSGLVRTSVNFTDSALLKVEPGDVLRFDGDVSNQGAFTVRGGELRLLAGFANNIQGPSTPPGRISLEDGTIHFFELLINDGVLSAARGANNVHGPIDNHGEIVVASDTVATFHDFVANSGGTITVLPRGNALFLADAMFQSASLIELSLGTDDMNANAAQIGATGAVFLGGELSVAVDSGYTPTLGDSFELISAGDGIEGTFDSVSLPSLGGGFEFGLLYGANSVLMEVMIDQSTITVPGDYNRDGTVDTADYVVWRSELGNASSLPNDDTPGVGQDDYTRWRANFGRTSPVSAATTSTYHAAAPEPSSMLLTVIAMWVSHAYAARRPRRAMARE
jgi:T5SS/PEP-CTERM-associated repeat protein